MDYEDKPDEIVRISDIHQAWLCLRTYCDRYQQSYQRNKGPRRATMDKIYELNQIDKHDIAAIQTHINIILDTVCILGPLFNGYYDDGSRVRLDDILNYIKTHIAQSEQHDECLRTLLFHLVSLD